MNYKSWGDEDLRRVLIADPDDTAAICEAAERFAKAEDYTEYDLDSARQEGFEDGEKEGYNTGYAEGKREDDSR